MTSTTPALVLVHGAFHRPSVWDLVIKELPDVDARAVQLPSAADVPAAERGDLHDDAQAVRDAVREVGGPVVVCAHSYAGAPVSEGLTGVAEVQRIVYLNAYLLEAGESVLTARDGAYPPHWGVNEAKNYVIMRNAEELFYNDLDAADAREAAAQLVPQSLRSFTEPLERAAWHEVPHTYVVGELDRTLPPSLREKFAARAETTVRMETSHAPLLSHPARTAQLLRESLAPTKAAV